MSDKSDMRWQWHQQVDEIQSELTGSTPFETHTFLTALQQSACIGEGTGWQLQALQQAGAVIPLFSKQHSYGEYIFDWSWADAYQQYGYQYYPKLIAASPFTPVPGARIWGNAEVGDVTAQIETRCEQQHYSSMHWLYINAALQQALAELDYIPRYSVQFHWRQKGYRDFDDFLERFASRKRKSVRKERALVGSQGIRIARLTGNNIDSAAVAHFFRCYQHTYVKRSGHGGYLNLAFFQQLIHSMREQILLVIAYAGDEPIASALFVFDQHTLFGRYWGALREVSGLHFECCLYQGIEFCLERGIASFNPGTQGEHKILRGFEPVWCYSAHKLFHPDFHQAVRRFCAQEYEQLQGYKANATSLLPFKSGA